MQIKEISFHKSTGVAIYIVGTEMTRWDEEKQEHVGLGYKPTKIELGFLFPITKKVTIHFSNGMTLVFRGMSVIYEI